MNIAGREFADWEDANRQAVVWCDKVNATYSPKLHAKRRDLFATELASLKPLPIRIPEVYLLYQRIVDLEGYVTARTNRYSCPWRLIGRRLEVRELEGRIEIYDGPREVARHARVLEPEGARITDPVHQLRAADTQTHLTPAGKCARTTACGLSGSGSARRRRSVSRRP